MKKVIKASAGTGKTYRLSLEYLAALLRDIEFSEIIVMTFTKKATAEIKNRILEHLRAIINNSSEKKNIINSLKNIYPELEVDKEKLKRIYKKMILNDEDIKIYTIDAFTNQIFSRGIAPFLSLYNYQIIDESQNQEIIEELLKTILNNEDYYLSMQNFLESNSARDLDPYLSFIKDIVNNAWKFMLLESKVKEELPQAEIVPLFEAGYQTLKNVAELRGEEFSSAYFVKDGLPFFEQYSELSSAEKKEQFIYQRRNYLLNNSYWSGNKLKSKKTAELKKKLKCEYQLFREKLAAAVYNQEVIPAEKEIIKFAELVLGIYKELKFKTAKFTHSDISNYTFKYLKNEEIGLLKDEEPSSYLLDLLGGEYKALFIDEFQDTSILQWKILRPLIKKAENFIAVGDEKQSIYGWRGGEKKLFASLEEIIGAETERLDCCYRSDQNIINFLNGFFAENDAGWEYHSVKANSEQAGLIEVIYGGSSASYNTHTKTFAKFGEEKKKQIEDLNSKIKEDLPAEIAADIKEKYADDYGKVSLLARTSNELNTIAECLDAEEIPYILENRNSLLDAALPRAIYNFLYFAAYRDFYSLLKFLRSDLIRIDNQSLKLILKNQQTFKDYFSLNQEFDFENEVELASKLGITRENNGTNLIEIFKKIKRIISGDYQEIVNFIYQKTELLQLAENNSLTLKNLYSFFKIINSFSSLQELLNYLSENRDSEELKQQKVENKDAVSLMTIHQSKGLSLPVEYYYWNPGRRSGQSSGGINFYLDFDQNYEKLNNYLFIQDQYLSILDWLDYNFKEQAERKEEMEEINNLYVALSRAEHDLNLYIEAPRKIKPDQDLMWVGSSYDYYEKMLLKAVKGNNLIDLLEKEKAGSKLKFDSEKLSESFNINPLNKYLKQKKRSAKTDKDEEKYAYFKKQSSSLKISASKLEGLALHYYLENIKYNTKDERTSAEKLLKNKYGNLLGKKKIRSVIEKAENFMKINSEIFSKKYQVFNEYLLKEKVEKGEKYYRIDRLLINQNEKKIKIIDYKSGSYRDPMQLEKYEKLLAAEIAADWEIESIFLDV
jgi:ATP-dependent exoDNAse (exonuclease V) beta subunit